MDRINRKEISLYEDAKAGLRSLIQQTASVFVGFLILLLVTGGTPSGFAISLSFILGIVFVAWSEQKRMTRAEKNSTFPHHTSIRLIGDRASGKTAYLVSLTRYSQSNSSTPVQAVIPLNGDSKNLADLASNILVQGRELKPTGGNDPNDLPEYPLEIVLKNRVYQKINFINSHHRLTKFILSCRDYAGEFFKILSQNNNPLGNILDSYIEDCVTADGIMLLIDGTSSQNDKEYAKSLEKFFKLSKQEVHEKTQKLRMAIVITKCDLPVIYLHRKNPKKLIHSHFPCLYEVLRVWQESGFIQIEYFSTSAFGMLASEPSESNSLEIGYHGSYVLKNPSQWKPIGLMGPIYWLVMGRRNKDLEAV